MFRSHFYGVICVLFSAVLFSAKSVLVKLAYGYGIDAITLLTLRMLVAWPCFLLLLWWQSERPSTITLRQYGALLVAGIVGYYGASILDFWGMTYISASLERIILFIYPTLTVLLSAVFLGRPITHRTWLAMAISYGGMVLIFASEKSLITPQFWLGSMLVFAGALAYAGYLVASGVLIPVFGAARFTALALSIATLSSLAHFLVVHEPQTVSHLPQALWWYSLVLGFFCTFLPATLLTQGIRRIGASEAALISAISPVITLFLGALLLQETLSLWQLLGASAVVGGVVLISFKPELE